FLLPMKVLLRHQRVPNPAVHLLPVLGGELQAPGWAVFRIILYWTTQLHTSKIIRGYNCRMNSRSILVLMSALAASAAWAQPLQKITINYPTRSAATWPMYIAKEGGIYQK